MATLDLSLPGDFSFLDKQQPQFVINIDNKQYLCHEYRIISFSPLVQRLFLCDQSLRSINVPLKDKTGLFSNIIDFINGNSIDIKKDNCLFYFQVAEFFENEDLMKATSEYLLSTSIDELIGKSETLFSARTLLLHYAKRFNSMDIDQLRAQPTKWIDNILTEIDDDKTIERSKIFPLVKEIVLTRRGRSPEIITLFSHVSFADLTPDEVGQFLELCPSHDVISGPLWRAVNQRLRKPVAVKAEENFPYKDDPFYGVLSYLTSIDTQVETDSFNMHRRMDSKFILLDGGGSSKWALSNLLKYSDSNKYWENSSSRKYLKEDQWIVIGLIGYKLRLTHYTISHSLNSANIAQPSDWRIYGSNDRDNWVLLDEVINAEELNYKHGCHTYYVPKCGESFTYFKIEQLKNFSKKLEWRYKFVLDAVELFGNLEEYN